MTTQDRTIEIGDYRFNEKKHVHELLVDGDYKPLIGVTTILSIIAKPALIQWAANQSVAFLEAAMKKLAEETEPTKLAGAIAVNWANFLEAAKTAHRKKKEAAGDVGSRVHEAIEVWIKTGEIIELDEQGQKMFDNFKEWVEKNNVKILKSELHVHSKSMWIGGILDLVIEMDGSRLIADIKTSSGIYNEHFFQMAAYDMCLEEMGEPKADGYLVINLKKTGEVDFKISQNKEINREAFKSALKLYQIINSLQ